MRVCAYHTTWRFEQGYVDSLSLSSIYSSQSMCNTFLKLIHWYFGIFFSPVTSTKQRIILKLESCVLYVQFMSTSVLTNKRNEWTRRKLLLWSVSIFSHVPSKSYTTVHNLRNIFEHDMNKMLHSLWKLAAQFYANRW